MATNLVLAQPTATGDNIAADIQNAFNGRVRLQSLLINLEDQGVAADEAFLKIFATDLAAVKTEPDRTFVDAQFNKFNIWQTAKVELNKRIEALRTIQKGLETQISEYKKKFRQEFIDLLCQQIEELHQQWHKNENEEEQLGSRIHALESELEDLVDADKTAKPAKVVKKTKG
jgi:chromosome segregation ATPase